MRDEIFLVFARADRHAWTPSPDQFEFKANAIAAAKEMVTRGTFDRAVVMEVGGTDAVPTFTYRYGTKRTA